MKRYDNSEMPGPQVFLSYASEDIEFARALAKGLGKAGATVWLDRAKVRAGDAWRRKLEGALEKADCCVVVLSPSAIRSSWVSKEVTFAEELGKRIIPIRYRPCRAPVNLAGLQCVTFDADYDAACADIMAALEPEPENADPDPRDYIAEIEGFRASRTELNKSRLAKLSEILGSEMDTETKLSMHVSFLSAFVNQDVSAYQDFAETCRTTDAKKWARATVRRLKALLDDLRRPSLKQIDRYYTEWSELR